MLAGVREPVVRDNLPHIGCSVRFPRERRSHGLFVAHAYSRILNASLRCNGPAYRSTGSVARILGPNLEADRDRA